MPRERMIRRDIVALASLIDRYGGEVVAREVEALQAGKRGRGRPRNANRSFIMFLRWSLIQGQRRARPGLSAAAAERAIRGPRPSGTLRKEHSKLERLCEAHPKLRQKLEEHLGVIFRIGAVLEPLGLYHPEIVNAALDDTTSEDEWLKLCAKFSPK
jgi:hypothetical protein